MIFTEIEKLAVLLEDWAKWCDNYREKTGYPTKSSGFMSGGINCYDDFKERSNNSVFEKITTAMIDLYNENTAYAAAIHRKYGISNVFRFPRNNYEQTLVLAHERLVIICKRKGIVL